MGNLIVTMWLTLDGFVSGPDNAMDWVNPLGDYQSDLVRSADTLVLGRVTYESFAGSWPRVPDNPEAPEGLKDYARMLNGMRKIVYSRTLTAVEWQNSTLKSEIVPEEIQALKRETDRNLVIYGSASIVQALTNLGLIDEYRLLLHPVVLGSGKPLFAQIKERVNMQLLSATTDPSGVVLLYYQPAQ
jgi:dihydrofolate reductase